MTHPEAGGPVSTSTVEVRPRRLVVVCRAVAVLVVVVFGVLSLLLPRGSSDGQVFGPADQIAFFCLGLLLCVPLVLLTRCRVRGGEQGLWVRNLLGERYFPWQVVVAVHLQDGAPWAQLELQDDETVSLLGLQAGDGEHAIDGVLALRRLLRAAHSGQG